MAMKTLTGPGAAFTKSNYVIANKLQLNESVEGYLVGYGTETRQLKNGRDITKNVLILQRRDGTQFSISADGNLKYIQADAEKKGITVGAFTQITKVGTKQTNFGPSGVFSLAQDADDVITDIAVNLSTSTSNTTTASANSADERIAQLKKQMNQKKA